MGQSRAVLVVEDDKYFRADICARLRDRGLQVVEAASEREAWTQLEKHLLNISVALLDIRFDSEEGAEDAESDRGRLAGLRMARAIREKHPQIRLIGMSLGEEKSIQEWFLEYGYAFLQKWWLIEGMPGKFVDVVERAVRRSRRHKPNVFIVHGHDSSALSELVGFLKKELRWKRLQILREMPSCGRTIIEKFEHAARNVDVVFVILTPDDIAAPANAPDQVKRRARQNVVFELGYFFAKLQRTGGRVILLYKADIELPSDISGIAYVDISNGVEAASEMLRSEVSGWL